MQEEPRSPLSWAENMDVGKGLEAHLRGYAKQVKEVFSSPTKNIKVAQHQPSPSLKQAHFPCHSPKKFPLCRKKWKR